MLQSLLYLAGLCWLDIGTGMLKSLVKEGETFSKKKLIEGLLLKCVYLILLAVAGYYAYESQDIAVVKSFITYFSACECISIIDNAIKMRPDLKNFLKGDNKK